MIWQCSLADAERHSKEELTQSLVLADKWTCHWFLNPCQPRSKLDVIRTIWLLRNRKDYSKWHLISIFSYFTISICISALHWIIYIFMNIMCHQYRNIFVCKSLWRNSFIIEPLIEFHIFVLLIYNKTQKNCHLLTSTWIS